MSFTINYPNAGINHITRPENTLIAELWGARGGSIDGTGARPGYIKVVITGVSNVELQIGVGGSPIDQDAGVNGGGAARAVSGYGGGGATSIRIGDLGVYLALAGGGGGSAYPNSGVRLGGYGGGGGNGQPSSYGGKGANGPFAGAAGAGYPSNNGPGSPGTPAGPENIGTGGGGIYAGGGGGFAGGGGGGAYVTNYGSGGGGSNGYNVPPGYTVSVITDSANVTTRPSGGTHEPDGYATLKFVNDDPLTLNITSPANNSPFFQGTFVTLTGNATSPADGNISSSIQWSLNGQLSLGTGASVMLDMDDCGLGVNQVTATVIDSLNRQIWQSITVIANARPIPAVSIIAPLPEAIVPAASYQFQGSAIDAYDGDISSQIQWISSINGPFATGANPIVAGQLSLGVHKITAEAQNSLGRSGSVNQLITVVVVDNNVIIVEPTLTVFSTSETIDWEGVATENVMGNIVYQSQFLEWYDQADIQFGTGASFTTASTVLPLGTSQIKALLPSTSTIALKTLTRTNDPPPGISILQPPNNLTVVQGSNINFQGLANDIPALNISADIVWVSDLDGQIGTGASFSISTLSINRHTITATVPTSRGPIFTSIQLSIQPPIGPFVTVSSPTQDSVYELADTVNFSATSFSSSGTNLTSGILWYSDIAGSLGGGGFISKTGAQLGLGHHIISCNSFDFVTGLTTNVLRSIYIVTMVCLHERSLMTMADRTKKEICQIRSGDLILGYDGQAVQVLRNIKFTNKPRDYIALLEKRNRAETLILPGHSILYNGFEMRPEQLCDLGCAVLRPAIGGHVFTLCTENRTFVRAGMTYNVATWSEDGLANFLTHDLFGRSLVVVSEQ